MRLCLVSSIIALIVSIHFQSQPEILVVWPVLHWIFQQGFKSWLIIVTTTLFVHVFVLVGLESRLQSRLPAQYSGIFVEGVGVTLACDASSSEVEKLRVKVISIDSAQVKNEPSNLAQLKSVQLNEVPALENLELSHYLNDRKAKTINKPIGCGQEIKFKAKLRAPYTFLNPHGFDYEAWQLSRGLDATGYLLSYQVISNDNSLTTNIAAFRQLGIERAVQLSGLAGQIVPALLFGEANYLDRSVWRDLQMTGTIHLLVVSGLHVGFIVMIISLALRLLVRIEMFAHTPVLSYVLRLTPVILLSACLMYSFMAGVGLAVQRASLMFMVAVLVSYYKAHWSLFDTWLWVACLILLINPLSSLFVGFWFSFVAVGALLLGFSGQAKQNKNALGSRFELLIKPQWIVFIALMPLLWIFQQSTSLLSLLANIIAIPLLGLLILPLSILSLIFPLGWPVEVLNLLLEWGLLFIQQMAQQSSLMVHKPSGMWLICLLPLVLVSLLFKGFPFRRLSLIVLVVVFFLPTENNQSRLLILDVGQGLSVLGVQQNKEEGDFSWLYDTGAKYRSGFSLGEAVVSKNILALTNNTLDLLFVSHSDIDHAGGEEGLRRKVDVVTAYAGQPEIAKHKDCHGLDNQWVGEAGMRWRVFDAELLKATDNNLSCVVQIEMEGKLILIPGDIEKRVERRLVDLFGSELKSDILIVPHHGSSTSSTEAFITQVDPSVAVVSSGFKNRFNHPHPDVVARYQRLGIPIFNSASSGAIEVRWSNQASIIEWRKENPPIWRQM